MHRHLHLLCPRIPNLRPVRFPPAKESGTIGQGQTQADHHTRLQPTQISRTRTNAKGRIRLSEGESQQHRPTDKRKHHRHHNGHSNRNQGIRTRTHVETTVHMATRAGTVSAIGTMTMTVSEVVSVNMIATGKGREKGTGNRGTLHTREDRTTGTTHTAIRRLLRPTLHKPTSRLERLYEGRLREVTIRKRVQMARTVIDRCTLDDTHRSNAEMVSFNLTPRRGSATSAIGRKRDASRAGRERRSATRPSLNVSVFPSQAQVRASFLLFR